MQIYGENQKHNLLAHADIPETVIPDLLPMWVDKIPDVGQISRYLFSLFERSLLQEKEYSYEVISQYSMSRSGSIISYLESLRSLLLTIDSCISVYSLSEIQGSNTQQSIIKASAELRQGLSAEIFGKTEQFRIWGHHRLDIMSREGLDEIQIAYMNTSPQVPAIEIGLFALDEETIFIGRVQKSRLGCGFRVNAKKEHGHKVQRDYEESEAICKKTEEDTGLLPELFGIMLFVKRITRHIPRPKFIWFPIENLSIQNLRRDLDGNIIKPEDRPKLEQRLRIMEKRGNFQKLFASIGLDPSQFIYHSKAFGISIDTLLERFSETLCDTSRYNKRSAYQEIYASI